MELLLFVTGLHLQLQSSFMCVKHANSTPASCPACGVHHVVRGAGERAGGWWWNRGDMTVRELDRMKSRELNNGRLAMCAASPLHSPRYVVRRLPPSQIQGQTMQARPRARRFAGARQWNPCTAVMWVLHAFRLYSRKGAGCWLERP